MFKFLLYSKLSAIIIKPLSSALEFPLERIISRFFKYIISSEKIIDLLIVSVIFTFPFALRIFKILSYSNSSAIKISPLSVLTIPFFVPLNLFPFSVISTSVISKIN